MFLNGETVVTYCSLRDDVLPGETVVTYCSFRDDVLHGETVVTYSQRIHVEVLLVGMNDVPDF